MTYESLPHPKPDIYKDAHVGASALIIGTGHSTKNLLKYKDKIREKFDVVIGLNFSTRDFEEQMDYHVVLEKNPVKIYNSIKSGKYRKDLPRILNWKGIEGFPNDMLKVKATRSNFDGKFDIREYSNNGKEGMLMGPQGNKGLSVGSVALNAIHFVGILGCKDVYLIGSDFLFKDEYDHYYPDNHYRKSTTKLANRSPIIDIVHDGSEYKTTKFFQESAQFIDKVISKECKSAGMTIFDFSEGLISKAKSLNLDVFMENS